MHHPESAAKTAPLIVRTAAMQKEHHHGLSSGYTAQQMKPMCDCFSISQL